MEPKVILITGATDGIGKETARELAHMGHHVLVHGRDAARGQAVVADIRRTTKNPHIDLVLADFSEMQQVRQLAAHILNQYLHLDCLINNAGVFSRERVETPDGLELTFAVNHLAPFLLTNLLLERLKASAPARIVTVSSGTHASGRIEIDNLQGEKHYSGYSAYANSKLANVLFAYELADELRGTHVTSNALHPGVITTKLLKAGYNMTGASLREGAATPVYLAVSPDVEGVTGKYFVNQRETPSAPMTHDRDLQQRLRAVSAELVGLRG